jgi:hypothetical protein
MKFKQRELLAGRNSVSAGKMLRYPSFSEKNFDGDIINAFHIALKCSFAWKNIKCKCTNEVCERDCEVKGK